MGTGIKRNASIELLRFILMIAICMWHTMVHGFNYANISMVNTPQVQHIIIMAICVPAVDTFMFISGYYGIRFSYDKLLKLTIQALLIANIITIIKLPFGGCLSFYDQLLPVSSGITWWFLSVYAVIMVLSPIINSGINTIDKKTFRNILIILFFIFTIVKYKLEGGGYNLITLLLVYLLGRYCNKAQIVLSGKKSVLLWLILFSLLLLIMFYQLYYGDVHSIWTILSYNNPIIILMSVTIFYFTLSIKNKTHKWASFLGYHSFSIYLISEMIGISLYSLWSHIFEFNIIVFILSIVVFCLLCEIADIPLCSINTYLRKKLHLSQ